MELRHLSLFVACRGAALHTGPPSAYISNSHPLSRAIKDLEDDLRSAFRAQLPRYGALLRRAQLLQDDAGCSPR